MTFSAQDATTAKICTYTFYLFVELFSYPVTFELSGLQSIKPIQIHKQGRPHEALHPDGTFPPFRPNVS